VVVTPPASSTDRLARNPGPDWGYGFLRLCDRLLPEFLFRPIRFSGTMVAMALMPVQRRHSREYLTQVLAHRPTTWDVFRHFLAFEEALMGKLRVGNGRDIPCLYDPSAAAFEAWMAEGGPVLLGTFHIGASDMLGFQIGSHEGRRVHIVRRRVGNSHDTERLAEVSHGCVQFIWGNAPSELIFAMKAAADTGEPIALQCDRIENARQTMDFEFLGARRSFPITIYRLALVLDRPVIMTVGVPLGRGRSLLYGTPRFELIPGEGRREALTRARAHFQEFLRTVERILRERPYLWFNFIPLNPAAKPGAERSCVP
jgi:predicted LPLAT superfamily acyltransferase